MTFLINGRRVSAFRHYAFFRQTLVGGNYELLDTDTLEPNPDFYVAALFQKLMGQRVLAVTLAPADPDLHVFAHCAQAGGGAARGGGVGGGVGGEESQAGDVTFAFINRSPTKTFEIQFGVAGDGGGGGGLRAAAAKRKLEFRLTAANASDEFSPGVRLNRGPPLRMPGYATLPELLPQIAAADKATAVDAFSVGFVVVQGAGAAVCGGTI